MFHLDVLHPLLLYIQFVENFKHAFVPMVAHFAAGSIDLSCNLSLIRVSLLKSLILRDKLHIYIGLEFGNLLDSFIFVVFEVLIEVHVGLVASVADLEELLLLVPLQV